MKNVIVLNEVDFVETAIAETRIRYSVRDTINRLARYYTQVKGYGPAETERALCAFIEAAVPVHGRAGWKRQAARYAESPPSRPLSRLDCIVITTSEMERVRSLKSALKERLLFTLIALAKYHNALRGDCSNWVGTDMAEIFALANIRHSNSVRLKLLGELADAGHIHCGDRLTSTALQIYAATAEGEPEVRIYDMRNLGYQYNALTSNEYTDCVDCGVKIKRRSNRQKYCNDCAAYHKMNRALENYAQQINAG